MDKTAGVQNIWVSYCGTTVIQQIAVENLMWFHEILDNNVFKS